MKEKGREEEDKKKRKKRRKVWIHDFEYGTRILYGILWLFGYLFEFALGLIWILVCSISRV